MKNRFFSNFRQNTTNTFRDGLATTYSTWKGEYQLLLYAFLRLNGSYSLELGTKAELHLNA